MAKHVDDNTLSLLDFSEPQEAPSSKIDVVKLSYISAEPMTWQELFEGYNELHAITFSSGSPFVTYATRT